MTKYIWFKPGIHHPIAEYITDLDANGTTYYSVYFYTNSNTTAVKEANYDKAIRVFPNPANEKLFFNAPVKFNEIALYDMNGKELFKEENSFQKNNYLITEQLPAGIYYLKLLMQSKNYFEKIIINH